MNQSNQQKQVFLKKVCDKSHDFLHQICQNAQFYYLRTTLQGKSIQG